MVESLQQRDPTESEVLLIEKAVNKTASSNVYLFIFISVSSFLFIFPILYDMLFSNEIKNIGFLFIAIFCCISLFQWYRVRNMVGATIPEARVVKYAGITSQSISGGGIPGAPKVGGTTVSLPGGWPFLWGAPVEILCLETDTGYRLAYEMIYLSDWSAKEAGKAHFRLQDDIDAGRLEVGGAHYALW